MARILLLDNDDANLKAMRDALSLSGKESEDSSYQSEEAHTFTIPVPLPPDASKDKTPDPQAHIYKTLNTKPYDFVFMEAAQIKGTPSEFMEEFRKKITLQENKNVPFVILTHNEDLDFVRNIVLSRVFSDLILKPIDPPLFRQKFSLMVSKNAAYKKEIYSLPTAQPVNVAFNFTIVDVSEFGLTLSSNRPYEPGDFVTFYSPVFKTEKKAEVIGKCYKSEKIGNTNEYHSSFVLVGVGDNTKKQIRNWMKLEYIKKKQAA